MATCAKTFTICALQKSCFSLLVASVLRTDVLNNFCMFKKVIVFHFTSTLDIMPQIAVKNSGAISGLAVY
jgi:hypothetical protein